MRPVGSASFSTYDEYEHVSQALESDTLDFELPLTFQMGGNPLELNIPDIFIVAAGQGNSALVRDIIERDDELTAKHYSQALIGATYANNAEIVYLVREYVRSAHVMSRTMSIAALRGYTELFDYFLCQGAPVDDAYELLAVLLSRAETDDRFTPLEVHTYHEMYHALEMQRFITLYNERDFSENITTEAHAPSFLSLFPPELLSYIGRCVAYGTLHLRTDEH